MHRQINPPKVAGSPSYSHAIEVVNPTRWLFIAGQVGRDSEGAIPDGIEAQAEIAFGNLRQLLKEAELTFDHLVDVTVYLVSRDDNPSFDKVRAKWLGAARPA